MSHSLLAAGLLAGSLALAAPAGAQGDAPLPVGSVARVRLTRQATDARAWRRDAVRWRGTVEQARADSFRLRLRDGRAYTFAWDDLARLEEYRGRESRVRSAARGAAFGMGIGMLFLGAYGVWEYQSCAGVCELAGLAVPAGMIVGGGTGLVVGGVFGAMTPGERWKPVALPARVGLAFAPGGAGVRVAF